MSGLRGSSRTRPSARATRPRQREAVFREPRGHGCRLRRARLLPGVRHEQLGVGEGPLRDGVAVVAFPLAALAGYGATALRQREENPEDPLPDEDKAEQAIDALGVSRVPIAEERLPSLRDLGGRDSLRVGWCVQVDGERRDREGGVGEDAEIDVGIPSAVSQTPNPVAG